MAGTPPLWPDTGLLDVYCHRDFWDYGAEVLGALDLPSMGRWLAYSDDGCPEKDAVLAAAGCTSMSRTTDRVAVDTEKTRFADVQEWYL